MYYYGINKARVPHNCMKGEFKMSNKYILNYSSGGIDRKLHIEDFEDAIFCEGRVFLKKRIEHCINTAPGQCWGVSFDFPAESFVDGEFNSRGGSLCIDAPGDRHEIAELISLDPLHIEIEYHVGVEYPAYGEEISPFISRHVARLNFSSLDDSLQVTGFDGAEHTILIPAVYDGRAVHRVDFRGADLSGVESLIISEGVEELALDFYTASKLRRLVIPEGVKLLCPLDDISLTPWFKAQRTEPVYISDCYCGTPGGGSGGVRSLVIPEGITSVAAGADFHSYWHSIKTPGTLRRVGRLAFATNHCLEELNLSEGVAEICDGSFYEAQRLKSLYLPDTLEQLGKQCFSRCFCLQDVSVARADHGARFTVHSLTLRLPGGEQHFSKSPPITVPITNRISAYPALGGFTAAGRHYATLSDLCIHPLSPHSREYLDSHGRKTWHIIVRSDCMYESDGQRKKLECWYIKTGDCITQIEQVGADGTILVQEGIGRLDIPYEMRNAVINEVFET